MLQGVFPAQKKDGTRYYRASVTYRRKHISLGSYRSESDAGNAYREACLILESQNPPLTLSDYDSSFVLSFEKWVVLINFRDNKMYFHTPIYVRPHFFYYYYSPELVLKFDTDDLFYYASHKIMKRGNHYFAADFGMQVNILNRYGIMNYAVCGRDYRFINGDTTDFRRENLFIINKYRGVSYISAKGRYCAKVHINGNYLVGFYETMEEAAIAYNKAVDILKQNGCQTAYVQNYLENMTKDAYTEAYMRLPVSKKIYELTFPKNQ